METTRGKTSKTKVTPATKSVLGRGLAPVIDDADVAYELDAGDVSVLPDVPGDAPLTLSDVDIVFVLPVPRPVKPALDTQRLTASHVRHVAHLVRLAREAA